MARFGEVVEMEMKIEFLCNSRMTIAYRISDMASGVLRYMGRTGHCYYHNELKRPIALSKYSPQLYQLLQAGMESEQSVNIL